VWSIYLGVEKAGIIEQLGLWFGRDRGIPILPLGGYHSVPFERQIAAYQAGTSRPAVLLYAGDLDASGEDIERNFLVYVHFDDIRRVGLTQEQAIEHGLPRGPGKRTDTRSRGFVEKYGDLFQIELDALPPDVLRDLFADALADYWDDAAFAAVLAREKAERRTL
jgi:hypothetical protein